MEKLEKLQTLKEQLKNKDILFKIWRYSRNSSYYMVSFDFPSHLKLETSKQLEGLILNYIKSNWSKRRIRRQWFSIGPSIVSFTVHRNDLEAVVSRVLDFCLEFKLEDSRSHVLTFHKYKKVSEL